MRVMSNFCTKTLNMQKSEKVEWTGAFICKNRPFPFSPNKMIIAGIFYQDSVALSSLLSLSELYLAHTVLLRPVHGHEPHVVYRIRCPPSRGHDWRLADHDQYGGRGHVLRHVPWSCNYTCPVLGCITPPVPREGNHLRLTTLKQFFLFTASVCFVSPELHVDANVILAVRFNITAMFYIISLLTWSYLICGHCAKSLENMYII